MLDKMYNKTVLVFIYYKYITSINSFTNLQFNIKWTLSYIVIEKHDQLALYTIQSCEEVSSQQIWDWECKMHFVCDTIVRVECMWTRIYL